jgi:hypothetical protein
LDFLTEIMLHQQNLNKKERKCSNN